MKEYLENINKAFESKARLGIMSILIVNESVDFVTLKNLLDLTDGNLASHTRRVLRNWDISNARNNSSDDAPTRRSPSRRKAGRLLQST